MRWPQVVAADDVYQLLPTDLVHLFQALDGGIAYSTGSSATDKQKHTAASQH
jgi:hypothetical protein